MKKKVIKICLLMMIATLLVPVNVLAYSYGDPTKEDVAETFILIKDKLSTSPADWSAAYEAYKVRRSEISSHFGESIAVTLDHNFELKEKDLVIQNYRYVLYLNLKRRFDYAEKDINGDYAKVKTLLGKAKGTFDVLKPHVESNIPNETSKLVSAFDLVLESIGNPGLFGMGKEPVKPEEFKKQTTYILTTLKPLFTYTTYTPVQPEKKDADESTETKQQSQDTNEKNESGTEQDQKNTTQKEQKNSVQTTTNQTTSASSEEQAKLSNQDENTDENSVANTDTENQQTEENKTTEQEEETTTNEEIATTEDNVTVSSEEQTIETSTKVEEVANQLTEDNTDKQIASGNTEHAPMEQTDRTNPVFTVIIILSVLVVLSGSIWFARKKNFI